MSWKGVKRWLAFAILIFFALWIGGFIAKDVLHTTGSWAFVIQYLAAGGIGYWLWEKWFRRAADSL